MARTCMSACVVLCLSSGAVAAAPIHVSEMTFETETRQSAWGLGDAALLGDSFFLGAAWNASEDFGEIVGGEIATTIPNPKRVAYDLCRKIPSFIRPNCGRRPDRYLRISVDTSTGAAATLSTSGRIGLDLGYLLDSGSLGAELDYTAKASLPDGPPPKPGEPFRLPTVATLSGGKFDSQSPTARATVDLVTELLLAASVQGCVIGKGCSDVGGTFVDLTDRRELLRVDPNRVTYLDGFTPDGLTFETPLIDRSHFEIDFDPVTGKISGGDADGDDQQDDGLKVNLAAFDIQVPELEMSKTLEPDATSLRLAGASPFLGFSADLDGLLTYAKVLPPAGASFGLSELLSASFDLIDAKAGPRIDVHQDFLLKPLLMVDLAFDREVQLRDAAAAADWAASFGWSGPWEELPEFILTGDTTFTPTFRVEALVDSSTWLQLGAALDLAVLQGSLKLKLGSLGDTDFSLDANVGPLFESAFEFKPDFARKPLFDGAFLLGGLGAFAGDPFRISFGATDHVVPLPAAAPLLTAALGLLAAAARRRRRSRRAAPPTLAP